MPPPLSYQDPSRFCKGLRGERRQDLPAPLMLTRGRFVNRRYGKGWIPAFAGRTGFAMVSVGPDGRP